ncbi:hypothetical protein LTR05_001453 [Lithohypha guttulata]|uniref:Steroid 5-alpha reductase C-terminal domain-containing protein n=1 Tax=Lithohypha guttulata TaxID=1690604 RepID=A0AAN7TGX2_9EURO|nr:hypothetical protein LTR05_001453 [Lithohypha guttulata]
MSRQTYLSSLDIDSAPVSSTITEHYPWQKTLYDVGIFKDCIYPSLALHGGLSVVAYGLGRLNNKVETKDFIWATAPIINAWWGAVGRRVFQRGIPMTQALGALSRPERLILGGVTLWGGRLFTRIFTRSRRRGKDNPLYDEMKSEPGFWNKALFSTYLPEALFQVLITLPMTAPFYHQGAVLSGYHPYMQSIAVGLFFTGFALETLADRQLDEHKETSIDEHSMLKDGVWSLCRHPNYLGDALVHFSFPLLLYASDMLAPIELLGSVANYAFLRYLGGDKATESAQERRYSVSSSEKHADLQKYRNEKHAFWPDFTKEYDNRWLWRVLGAGAAGAVIEQAIHTYL